MTAISSHLRSNFNIMPSTVYLTTWFLFVRTRATNSGIWNLVNPETTPKPLDVLPPIKPVFILPIDPSTYDPAAYEVFKVQTHIYKLWLGEYEKQQKAYADLITFIQETVTVQNATYIQKVDAHPWNLLRALKERLAPSDEARSIEIENKYHKLCKGPGKQDMEIWIEEWQTVYAEGKAYGISEVSGTRPIRDFIMAILIKEAAFANTYLIGLKNRIEEEFYEIVKEFRSYIRMHQTQKINQNTHSAFASEKKKEGQGQGATFNG